METKLPAEEERLRRARQRRRQAESAGAASVKRMEEKIKADLEVLRKLPGADKVEERRKKRQEKVKHWISFSQ